MLFLCMGILKNLFQKNETESNPQIPNADRQVSKSRAPLYTSASHQENGANGAYLTELRITWESTCKELGQCLAQSEYSANDRAGGSGGDHDGREKLNCPLSQLSQFAFRNCIAYCVPLGNKICLLSVLEISLGGESHVLTHAIHKAILTFSVACIFLHY